MLVDADGPFKVHARVVVAKFDGPADASKLPVEVVLIEDGQEVQRWTGEDVRNAPQA